MINESILLLGALVFLGIRNDYVKRGWAFVAAILCWGVARAATELVYSNNTEYNWGSMPAYLTMASWYLCTILIAVACYGKRRVEHKPASADSGKESKPATPEEPQSSESKLRELLSD